MNAETLFLHGGPDDGPPVRHDFSTNANACGPCPEVLAAVRHADATRYPDPRYHALRERLAGFHGVTPERVVIAGSASEFIFRLTAAVARRGGGTVALPRHGYGDYLRAARAWGLVPCAAPGEPDDAGADDPATMPSPAPALAWFCDPSSPLGQPVAGLGPRIDRLDMATTCVLDLAYEPLRLDGTLGLGPAQLERVWQLWTPNKALGLTGVRAAHAIAPSGDVELRELLMLMAPSWATGAHGVALLDGWTRQSVQDWLRDSRVHLRAWRDGFLTLCGEHGWRAGSSVANFLCVDPDVDDIDHWVASLRDAGIKVRPTASFGLPGQCRLAVLPPRAQDALRAAVSGPAFPGRASAPASCSRRSS